MKCARRHIRFGAMTGAVLLFAGAAYSQGVPVLSPSGAGTVALTNGFTGQAYAFTISESGTIGAPSWSISAGLPGGLTFAQNLSTPTNADITGTPTTVGTFVFTVSVKDLMTGLSASQSYSITVVLPLTITTPLTLPAATIGFGYNVTLTAINGTPPYTWSSSPIGTTFLTARTASARPLVTVPPLTVLPGGLSLSSAGVLSGAPSLAGTFTFPVYVTDSVFSQFASANLTLTVNPAPVLASAVLIAGTTGVPYGPLTLSVQGGTAPYRFSLFSGSSTLPPGVSLTAAGVISGTPTKAGSYSFSVLVFDNWGANTSANLILPITQGIAITTPSPLPNGTVGTVYQVRFASTGSGTLTWRLIAGSPPTGFTLNSVTGFFTILPTVAGTFQFTIQVTDATGATASSAYTLTINPQLLIGTTSLPGGLTGTSYSQNIAVSGGTTPYSCSVSTGILPKGLTLSSTTGGCAISGTPTTPGPSSFTVQVTDAVKGTASKNYTISISPSLTFTTASPLPPATAGTAYNESIAVAGGTPPYTFASNIGTLPAGITFNANGQLSGTPTNFGAFSFFVTVTDASQSTLTQAYTLTVAPPALSTPTIGGVNDTEPPAQQPALSVQLAQAYPLPLTGTITLTFTSAAGNVDDPAIQFSTGGRTATFTVAAGATSAVFSSATLAISTGTVAGQIILTLVFESGGQNVTPQPTPTRVINLPAQAPVITKLTAQHTGSGIEVDATGFSNTRDMVSASFQFQAAPGTNLQTAQFTIPVDALFGTWFADPNSQQFGSNSTYAQQFTIAGNAAGITGVTLTLTNKTGASTAVTATVQ